MAKSEKLVDQIIEAIEEARILECAMEEYSKERILVTAQRLSGTTMTTEEIDQFINSLTTSQFNEINKFISNAPTLKYDVKFTCESCGKENHNVLEGIQDFFS